MVSLPGLLLILQLSACYFMTGLIWMVQLVHYPTFAFVSEHSFEEFESFHQSAISIIVMPVMIFELVTAVYLVTIPSPISRWLWINLGLLGLIWLSTFVLSVPQHNILSKGMDSDAIKALVATNWPRTLLWTIRSGILVFVVSTSLGKTW